MIYNSEKEIYMWTFELKNEPTKYELTDLGVDNIINKVDEIFKKLDKMKKQTEVLPLVLYDLYQRVEKGKKEYGEPLKTFNGRNALRDAYEEVLDLAMYLRQQLEEQETK